MASFKKVPKGGTLNIYIYLDLVRDLSPDLELVLVLPQLVGIRKQTKKQKLPRQNNLSNELLAVTRHSLLLKKIKTIQPLKIKNIQSIKGILTTLINGNIF